MDSIWHGGRALAKRLAWTAGRAVLDALLPPQCLACRALIDEPGRLCPDCWSAIAFIDGPVCDCCGLPFETSVGRGLLCGACLRRRPLFRRARAAMRYDEASRGLILAFKHGDRTEAAGALAGWLFRAGATSLADADLLLPVPLHYTRLVKRRYNQSAMLAGALARLSGIDQAPALLRRLRATPSQGGLNRRQRRRNVSGAFGLDPTAARRIDGRRLVLIDDVYTTGATVEACARTLLHNGAASVDVLTIARVVRLAGETL